MFVGQAQMNFLANPIKTSSSLAQNFSPAFVLKTERSGEVDYRILNLNELQIIWYSVQTRPESGLQSDWHSGSGQGLNHPVSLLTTPSPWYHYSAFLTLLPWDNLKELWQCYSLPVLYQHVTHTEGKKMHWPYASSLPPVFKHHTLLLPFQKYWQTVQNCFVLTQKASST